MSQSVHQSQPVSRHPSTKEEEGPRKKLVSAVLFEKLIHLVSFSTLTELYYYCYYYMLLLLL